jgi:hypothetical protein
MTPLVTLAAHTAPQTVDVRGPAVAFASFGVGRGFAALVVLFAFMFGMMVLGGHLRASRQRKRRDQAPLTWHVSGSPTSSTVRNRHLIAEASATALSPTAVVEQAAWPTLTPLHTRPTQVPAPGTCERIRAGRSLAGARLREEREVAAQY